MSTDDKPKNGSDVAQAKRGAVRVKNLQAIMTSDGDLVVAGTHGTLIAWVYTKEGNIKYLSGPLGIDHALVLVRWDSYLFVDSDGGGDDPQPCTLTCAADGHDPASERGIFQAETEASNIVMV